ncbi:MAG TPA: carboxylesterase family protein [Longimicrobium sp.]|nr:carboxylesterase family protein [Longimicrobium sp.]
MTPSAPPNPSDTNHLRPSRARRRTWTTALTAAAAIALAGAFTPAAGQGPSAPSAPACDSTTAITTAYGKLCGITDTVTVGTQQVKTRAWLGIPYAKAPVGANRWQPPVDTSFVALQATQRGPKCVQDSASYTRTISGNDTTIKSTTIVVGSEGCLYLNVWAPPGTTGSSALPVMVFIHGGAFVTGTGASPLYRGAYMAARGNVVIVTINYRLGPFGFLSAPNARGGLSFGGNQGLLDQQKALQWVQRAIAPFGGDPGKVTLFGESAGAMSVGLHLFSVPTSTGLFRAAIMESNPMGVQYKNTARADSDGTSFLNTLCVRAAGTCTLYRDSWAQRVDAATVMAANGDYLKLGDIARVSKGGLTEALPWTPVVDGAVVTGEPYRGYAAGTTAKPFIFGMNRDEGVYFAAAAQKGGGVILDPTVFRDIVRSLFDVPGDTTNQHRIMSTADTSGSAVTLPYNPAGHASIANLDTTASAMAQLITDYAFNCGNLVAANVADTSTAARISNAAASLPVYAYRFEQHPFFNLYAGVTACTPGADTFNICHAYELPYVFHSLAWAQAQNWNTAQPTPADAAVSDAMVTAWTAFAANPGQAPAQGWQAYTPGGATYLFGGSGGGQMQGGLANGANCSALWSTLPPLNGTTVKGGTASASLP